MGHTIHTQVLGWAQTAPGQEREALEFSVLSELGHVHELGVSSRYYLALLS